MTQTVRNPALWQIPVLLLGLALLLAGCGPATNVGQAKANTSVATSPAESAGSATVPAPSPAEVTTEAPPAGPKDFAMSVKILSQECFGSAGCNLTYRAQINHGPPAGTYEVSYEVVVPNDTNSPYQDTLTVTDGQYDEPFQGMASPSRRVKNAGAIKVKVTAVEAR
jgi:hypothetical protein